MLQSLRLAFSGQGSKQASDHAHGGISSPLRDGPDVECPSSNGLVNRWVSSALANVVFHLQYYIVTVCFILYFARISIAWMCASSACSSHMHLLQSCNIGRTAAGVNELLKGLQLCRSSSRSSSPVSSSSVDVYRTPLLPRMADKLAQHGSARSNLSALPSYPPGGHSHCRHT